MIVIKVSGKKMEIKAKNVAELVSELGIDTVNIAIVKNGLIVPKANWSMEIMKHGDSVEVFSPISGG